MLNKRRCDLFAVSNSFLSRSIHSLAAIAAAALEKLLPSFFPTSILQIRFFSLEYRTPMRMKFRDYRSKLLALAFTRSGMKLKTRNTKILPARRRVHKNVCATCRARPLITGGEVAHLEKKNYVVLSDETPCTRISIHLEIISCCLIYIVCDIHNSEASSVRTHGKWSIPSCHKRFPTLCKDLWCLGWFSCVTSPSRSIGNVTFNISYVYAYNA